MINNKFIFQDLVQWLTDQEQVLLDNDKENGDDDKWTFLSRKFDKLQVLNYFYF